MAVTPRLRRGARIVSIGEGGGGVSRRDKHVHDPRQIELSRSAGPRPTETHVRGRPGERPRCDDPQQSASRALKTRVNIAREHADRDADGGNVSPQQSPVHAGAEATRPRFPIHLTTAAAFEWDRSYLVNPARDGAAILYLIRRPKRPQSLRYCVERIDERAHSPRREAPKARQAAPRADPARIDRRPRQERSDLTIYGSARRQPDRQTLLDHGHSWTILFV